MFGTNADLSLRTNYSGTDYPPPTNVTFVDYSSFYAYSPFTLWLSYGIAILVGLVPVVLGYMAIIDTSLSYSMSFSTVLRTTSHTVISATISSQDAVGQDPLPKHLARASVTFGDRWQNEPKRGGDGSASEDVEMRSQPVPMAQLLDDHE